MQAPNDLSVPRPSFQLEPPKNNSLTHSPVTDSFASAPGNSDLTAAETISQEAVPDSLSADVDGNSAVDEQPAATGVNAASGRVASRLAVPLVQAQQRTLSDKQAVQFGMRLQQQGQLVQAESIYRQIIAQQPRQADALHLLGLLMHQRGRHELAIDFLRRAIDSRPAFATYRSNLGVILRAMGDRAGALQAYAGAIRLAPDSAELHNNLAVIHDDLGDTEQALRHGWLAVGIDPKYPEARNNLANVLCRQGRVYESILQLQEALKARPDYVDAWYNLGLALERLGDYRQAAQSYDKALSFDPEHVNARANRALLSLLQGDFTAGFEAFEWRWRRADMAALRRPRTPQWDGQPIPGKRLLLVAEQGLGDAIMFSRYALLAAKVSGAQLLGECDGSLRELFGSIGSVAHWVDRKGPLPEHDVHIPWMSLPRVLKTNAQNIPAPYSYLRPPSSRVNDLDLRLDTDLAAGRKVGIVWSGNPALSTDDHRSCPFSHFLQLLQVPGLTLVSLQKGERAQDWKNIYAPARMRDMAARCRDFADTATVIAQLDLVISVDTAVAHLAGALGRPVWLLLPKAPDWRWQLKREDSPWYPTARLFRQEVSGDWAGLFARVQAALLTV